MGFSVCVSSEAATCSSLSSLLPSLWPSRPRPIPSTATTELSHTPTAMLSLAFHSVLPLVWTPSPRVLTPRPRELSPLPTTTARGPLMLRLIPTTLVATLSPTPATPLLLVSPSDPPPDWTPSPRALMPPPRDTLRTPTATSDTTTARGPLTPTTLVATPDLPSLTLPTVSLLPLSPLDPPLAWTPSPRALMPLPRDTLLTPTATLDTTTVKF